VPHQTAARMPHKFPIKIGHPHIIDSGGQMAKLNKKNLIWSWKSKSIQYSHDT
jgi:hypothetical protein